MPKESEEILSEQEAYDEVIGGLNQSGYGSSYITQVVLHLQKHPLTRRRCCLLSRGYSPRETEKLIKQGKWHNDGDD